MKKLIFFLTLIYQTTLIAQITPSIEGKWVVEDYPNTMYILENGNRYTYYCPGGNCDSLYQTFVAGDGNHLPEVQNYTFQNDTLTIDLNFGSYFTNLVIFECDSNIIDFVNPNQLSRWVRLGVDVNDCQQIGIDNKSSNVIKIYPNPVQDILYLNLSNVENLYYRITSLEGKLVKIGKTNGEIDLIDLQKGNFFIEIETYKIHFLKN